MRELIRELLPHAPHLGLHVEPHLPADKVEAAIRDYGQGVSPDEVVALYDATRLGTARDGALFCADRFVFQNNDLEATQVVRYGDIVRVSTHRKLLGGRKIEMDVNRGRATVGLVLDFSARGGAAEYVARLFHEAILREDLDAPAPEGGTRTDAQAVRRALDALHARGKLSGEDREAMLAALG